MQRTLLGISGASCLCDGLNILCRSTLLCAAASTAKYTAMSSTSIAAIELSMPPPSVLMPTAAATVVWRIARAVAVAAKAVISSSSSDSNIYTNSRWQCALRCTVRFCVRTVCTDCCLKGDCIEAAETVLQYSILCLQRSIL
jgi:hypothetical protein